MLLPLLSLCLPILLEKSRHHHHHIMVIILHTNSNMREGKQLSLKMEDISMCASMNGLYISYQSIHYAHWLYHKNCVSTVCKRILLFTLFLSVRSWCRYSKQRGGTKYQILAGLCAGTLWRGESLCLEIQMKNGFNFVKNKGKKGWRWKFSFSGSVSSIYPTTAALLAEINGNKIHLYKEETDVVFYIHVFFSVFSHLVYFQFLCINSYYAWWWDITDAAWYVKRVMWIYIRCSIHISLVCKNFGEKNRVRTKLWEEQRWR